jgi:hypothetical protein
LRLGSGQLRATLADYRIDAVRQSFDPIGRTDPAQCVPDRLVVGAGCGEPHVVGEGAGGKRKSPGRSVRRPVGPRGYEIDIERYDYHRTGGSYRYLPESRAAPAPVLSVRSQQPHKSQPNAKTR